MNPTWNTLLAERGAAFDGDVVSFAASAAVGDIAPTFMVPLTHLGLVRSRGDDSAPFLHNLLSNDVKKLAPDAAQWNSFNTPKGRMLASFLLWGTPTDHWLAISADIKAAILKKLSMYVLRSKAKLTDVSDEFILIGLTGPLAVELAARAGVPTPEADMRHAAFGEGFVVRLNVDTLVLTLPVADAPAQFDALQALGAQAAGTAAWQLAMIRAGIPLITLATQEEFVAQMLNYELLGGVSFNKGCYPGQEIVARTQYLGKLKKRMYRVCFNADTIPAVGTDIYTPEFGEQSAGKLVNVAPAAGGGFEALAVMQMSCAEAGEAHLGSPDGPRLGFLDLPYNVP